MNKISVLLVAAWWLFLVSEMASGYHIVKGKKCEGNL